MDVFKDSHSDSKWVILVRYLQAGRDIRTRQTSSQTANMFQFKYFALLGGGIQTLGGLDKLLAGGEIRLNNSIDLIDVIEPFWFPNADG